MKHPFIPLLLPVFIVLVTACSHPLEIEGEGDILSASGDRDCLLEDFQSAQDNCTENLVILAYLETYFAQPRPGWQFDRWVTYCEDVPGNECSFDIPASAVQQFWGETVPPLRAVFTEIGAPSFPLEKYQSSCAACHVSGAAGAPKTGDVAAWEPRLAKGMDALVESVKNGMNAMPPTGLCANCTDEEYGALITYMASPAD